MIAQDPRLGTLIGNKYRITRFLAAGGMGAVYEAQHVVVRRRFAVKFLRAELSQRRDMLARFKLEAEAAGALESENIAAVLDFGFSSAGAPYLVMEYLDGVSLADLLKAEGPLPAARAADLVVQACAGIQRAHEAGVLHRDLKPRNLFVCRRADGTDLVKVVDFGVAKLLDEDAGQGVTATGGMVGTPCYMAPEQARGEALIDARADVYALGAILYELLAGHPPHPGASYPALIHHISTQPPLPLASRERPLPPALIAVVEQALASQADQRPGSAAELGRSLDEFARRQVWPVPNAAASAALDSTLLAAQPASISAPRPSWARLALWGLLVSAALLGALLWPLRRASSPPAVAVSVAPIGARAPDPTETVRTRPADVPAEEVSLPTLAHPPAPDSVSPPALAERARTPETPRRLPSRERAGAKKSAVPAPVSPAPQPKGAAEFDSQNPY